MKNLAKLIVTAILTAVLVPFAGTAAHAVAPLGPLYVGGIGADTKIVAEVYYDVIESAPSTVVVEAVAAANDASPALASCSAAIPAIRCTITGLTNGTAYFLRAYATNSGGNSVNTYSPWGVTPTASPVIFGAEYDCGTDTYRVQPCQLSVGTTHATVYGQGLETCTEINMIGGGLPGGNPIEVTPSIDGTSAVLHITEGSYGWANFNCGLGTLSAFLGHTVYNLSQFGAPSWSQTSGPAGTVVEVTSNVYKFLGITSLQLGGIDVSYTVINANRILITIPAGLPAGWATLTMTNIAGTGSQNYAFEVTSSGPSITFSQGSVSPCGTVDFTTSNITTTAIPAIYVDGVQVPSWMWVFGDNGTTNTTWEWLVSSTGNSTGYLENDVVYTMRYISDAWNGTSAVPFSDPYLATASITLTAGYACGTEPELGFSSISPASGTIAGGTQVTITGTAFDESTGVTIGGEICQIISRTATQIVCSTPAGLAGAADIVITSEGADTVTASNAFTFVAPVTLFTPKKPEPSQVNVTVGDGSLKVELNYDGTKEFKPSGYSVYVKPGGNSCIIPTGATSCEIIGLKPGTEYEVVVTAVNAAGISPSLTLPNKYLIGKKSNLKLLKKLTIRPFAGDSAKLTSSFKAQLKKFVAANPDLTAFTCTGYTAGKPVKSSDKTLAKARANAVCGYIQKLNPEVTTTVIGLTPGLSWSANNRKVLVKGYGLSR